MKHYITATLCSAFILPGLGQIVNRQFIKGLALIGAISLIFLGLLIKFFLDITAVMSEVIGPDLSFGQAEFQALLTGLRHRDLTLIWVLLALGIGVWAYSIADAYIQGRRYVPPENREG